MHRITKLFFLPLLLTLIFGCTENQPSSACFTSNKEYFIEMADSFHHHLITHNILPDHEIQTLISYYEQLLSNENAILSAYPYDANQSGDVMLYMQGAFYQTKVSACYREANMTNDPIYKNIEAAIAGNSYKSPYFTKTLNGLYEAKQYDAAKYLALYLIYQIIYA